MKTLSFALLSAIFFISGLLQPCQAQIPAEYRAEIAQSAGEHVPADSFHTKYPKFDQFLRDRLEFFVPVISVEELQKKVENNPKQVIILDAREKEAYDISHLPNAKRVGFNDFSPESVWMIPRDAEIVVYCLMGTRSEQVGKYLEIMGFKNVKNLYGSIFEWSNNEGKLISKEGEETNKVYVSDKSKLQFLKKGKPILADDREITNVK